MKKRLAVFINELVWRWFPAARNIHFRTPDGVAHSTTLVDGTKLMFGWLKKPIKVDSPESSPAVPNGDTSGTPVVLNFYTTTSVDKFIDQLEKIKRNIAISEMNGILENGGELVWVDKSVQPSDIEGVEIRQYSVSVKLGTNNEIKPQ